METVSRQHVHHPQHVASAADDHDPGYDEDDDRGDIMATMIIMKTIIMMTAYRDEDGNGDGNCDCGQGHGDLVTTCHQILW